MEFGVGNGMENNTLALAALGWTGLWAGSEELAFNLDGVNAGKFYFSKAG